MTFSAGNVGWKDTAKRMTVVLAVETPLAETTNLNKPFISFSGTGTYSWGAALSALDTSAGTAQIQGTWANDTVWGGHGLPSERVGHGWLGCGLCGLHLEEG